MLRAARSTRASPAPQDGIALVAVIWGLGLIALMCITIVAAARWRLAAAANLSGAAQAASLADAAVTIATAGLSSGSGEAGQRGALALDGKPRYCSLPQGAVAAVIVEDEGGKVDLNAAPARLLEALLTGFGAAPGDATAMAQAIIAFRSASGGPPPPASESTSSAIPPKHALFQTIFELDQVAAIPPGLVRELYPFVTISSGRAGIDPAVAPPALLAALSGAPLAEVRALIATPYPNSVNRTDPRLPLPFLQIRPGGTLLVHAEATMPGGAIAVREVLIDVRRPFGAPVVIKEVRHGAARYGAALAALLRTNGTAIPAC